MLVTIDFETYYSKDVTLTKQTTMQYIHHPDFKVWGLGIKIEDSPTEWFSGDEVDMALSSLLWEETTILAHNTAFDGAILTRIYGYKPQFYLDTASMARAMYPGHSSSLRAVAERLFPDDISMRKGDALSSAKGIYDLPPNLEQDIADYCIQDVELTYAIYKKWADFPQSELEVIDATIKMFTEPRMILDTEQVTAIHQREKAAAEQLIELSGYSREDLASNSKFEAILESLGIEPPKKLSPATNKLIPAFGKNDPGFQQLVKDYPEHKDLWDARIATKSRLRETRAKRFLEAANPDGTISIPLRYYAAHTGRFGGSDKLNFQNMPRGSELRRCLKAPKGELLYAVDLSNIEARMLAWLAGQDSLLEKFRYGVDVYSSFASDIYGFQVNGKDYPEERFVGKTAVLGLGYGMGWKKFQATLASGGAGPQVKLDDMKCQEVVAKYRATFYLINYLWAKCSDFLVWMTTNKYVPHKVLQIEPYRIVLPNGLSLYYENLRHTSKGYVFDSRNGETYTYGGKITENIVQALSRLVITDAILRINKISDFRVVLTVHDEIIVSSASTDHADVLQTIIHEMTKAPEWAKDIPLNAEGSYGEAYSK